MLISDSVIVLIEKLVTFQSRSGLYAFVDAASTLSGFCPKDKTPDLQQCGVVYQFTCPQYQYMYVGETGRTLATRMKDHTSHNTQPTAVGDHCRDHGHVISKNNVEVVAREEGWFKRKVREAIEIKTLQPTINRDQGFDLPAIYSKILPVIRNCSRQTSDHPALTNRAVASRSLTK